MDFTTARPHSYVYLAAPFFNVYQTAFLEIIETSLTECGIPYYSPRRDATPFHPGDRGTENVPEQTFSDNLNGIAGCGLMVAVLDYLLPMNFGTYLVEMPTPNEELVRQLPMPSHQKNVRMKPISLPDSGTTFEMGVASGFNIPILGFLANPTTTINLMLAVATKGIVVGPTAARMVWRKRDDLKASEMFSRNTWREFINLSHVKNAQDWRLQ